MSVWKKFSRDRRGISTNFAGVFLIILMLMSFNLMTWTFIQYDAYNTIVLSMRQRDQQATSENLAVTPPGATGFAGNSFNIIVNNTSKVMVSVTRIYISNLSPTGSTQCSGSAPCIIDPSSPTNCAGNGNCIFTGGNIQSGENDHNIRVTGLTVNDGSGYMMIISSTRGRQFSFYYPWPVNILGPSGASNSNTTNTAHGPLDIQLAPNSLNFTMNAWTQSQPAWNVPYNVNVVFWAKVVNNGIYPITLSKWTNFYMICQIPGRDCEDLEIYFISDNRTVNPSSIIAYDEVNRPVVLPPAGPNGPTGFTIVKFGSWTPASATPQAIGEPTPWVVFLIFFFKVNGQVVGQTLTFYGVRTCTTYPSCP